MGYGKEGDFLLKKFWHTGKEMFVEMRSALHTGRGKGGMLLFLIPFIYGVFKFHTEKGEWDDTDLLVPVIWMMTGLEQLFNLQNHKLLYLLPVSRKEFASIQVQKMLWRSLIMLGVIMLFSLNITQESLDYGMLILRKAVPISLSISSYNIISVQPVKGNNNVGSKIYQLSYAVIYLNIGIMFVNFIVTEDFRSAAGWIIPVMNYIISIYTVIYFYRRISYSDVYYDELQRQA